MADKEQIKWCLDDLGRHLQGIATMEEKDYPAFIFTENGMKTELQSYSETVRDIADIANVQILDQLYNLLEIEV